MTPTKKRWVWATASRTGVVTATTEREAADDVKEYIYKLTGAAVRRFVKLAPLPEDGGVEVVEDWRRYLIDSRDRRRPIVSL